MANSSNVMQDGDRNDSNVLQFGFFMYQLGDDKTALTMQLGADNTSYINQYGTFNTAWTF